MTEPTPDLPLVGYVSARTLAQHYYLKESYVYVLAGKGKWRRVQVGRQTRYWMWDADRDLRPGVARRRAKVSTGT